jgi:O-antigen/teichoic acid export membrane protein
MRPSVVPKRNPNEISLISLVSPPRLLLRVGLIYGVSVSALGLSDMALAHLVSTADFGTYQYVRQLVPLLVIVSLSGVDQVIGREYPGGLADRFDWTSSLPNLCGIGLGVGVFAATASLGWVGLPPIPSVALALTVPILICSELCAGYLRARGLYPEAAFIQQGYRLCLATLVIASLSVAHLLSKVYAALVPASGIVFSLVGIQKARTRLSTAPRVGTRDLRRLRSLGFLFALSLLSLGALDWIDQAALLHRYHSFSISGAYVSAKVYFTFPFVSLASILGFAMLPEIAKLGSRVSVSLLNRLQLAFLGIALVLSIPMFLVARMLPFLFPVEPSPRLLLLLIGAGVGRLCYVVPSGVIGALADKRVLWRYVALGVGSLGLEGAVILLGSVSHALELGACGLFVGVWVRTVCSYLLVRRFLQTGRA